jgi:hypothetical protein
MEDNEFMTLSCLPVLSVVNELSNSYLCEQGMLFHENFFFTQTARMQVFISRLFGSEYINSILLHETFYVPEHQQQKLIWSECAARQ